MEHDIEPLRILVGEWEVEAIAEWAPADVRGRATFEWMPGERFLIQRWETPAPAPDGLAVIGPHEDRDGLVQHYFDSRGVHRVYDMALADGVWTLEREHPGFDQRWRATFSDDGATIEGEWEMRDDGANWRRDFGLVYTRVA
jgi:hypothetical protein